MAARPSSFISWTDGNSGKVTQPPSNYALQGFVAGQAPAYQYVNWLLYTLDQWCQYLDGKGGGSGGGSQAIASNPRLINGGTWSFNSANTVAWSASFNVAIPGQTDASNVVASGGVTLTDGQVAYVNLNIPFSYTATLTSGSTSVTSLSSTAGLTVGMGVSGTGIAASTTISSISGTTLVLNNAATASGSGSVLTFQSSGTLTAATATESTMSAGPQTAIFARNNGGVIIVGIGAGEMQLRPGEAKALRGNGFGASCTGTAGFAITAGQACYISPGGSAEGRSAGSVFPTDVSSTSATSTPARINGVGIATQSVASGQTVTLMMNGIIGGYTGLTIGQPVYLDPSVVGGVTQAFPGPNNNGPISSNAIVLVGIAVSTTQIYVRMPSSNASFPVNPTFGALSATSGSFASVAVTGTMSAGAVATPILNTPLIQGCNQASINEVDCQAIVGNNSSNIQRLWSPDHIIWAAGVASASNAITTQLGAGIAVSAAWSTISSGSGSVARLRITFYNNIPTSGVVTYAASSAGLLTPCGYQVNPGGLLPKVLDMYFTTVNGSTLVYTTVSFQIVGGQS